jgi:Dyp-type peroxidase family
MRGDTLTDALRGHEHFGYRDGISQPSISTTTFGSGHPIAAGEFVLGYPIAQGSVLVDGLPDWSENGSFLVFLKLRQHVEAFARALKANSRQAGLEGPVQLGAAVVGRWKSGAPAGAHLADIRSTGVDPQPDTDLLEAAKTGEISRYSHSGRANPGDVVEDVNRHRLIRRGIPYAEREATANGASEERGLLFLAYQSNIHEQFEHVWGQWLNGADFPTAGAGTDPLVGQADESRVVTLDDQRAEGGGAQTIVRLGQFVTPQYAGYFFSPSIRALSILASGGSRKMSDQETIKQFFDLVNNNPSAVGKYLSDNQRDARHISAPTHRYVVQATNGHAAPGAQNAPDFKAELESFTNQLVSTDLGSFIANEYPYPVYPGSIQPDPLAAPGPEMGGPAGKYHGNFAFSLAEFTDVMRQEILHWELNGVVSNITKGIRLPFTYQLPSGEVRHGQLMIGYAGPPW